MTEQPIRSAATVILWRDHSGERQILMGQRGAGAVFMPSKYVFPGGAVDPEDAADPSCGHFTGACQHALTLHCLPDAPQPDTLAATARHYEKCDV